MKRIIIIGCCGSGKSTLSKKLSSLLSLPAVHLDKLFWQEGWVSVGNEEFDKRLDEALKKECWIIDGNFSRTLPKRLERCDTVIYLDYPALRCVFRVLKRVISSHGRVRGDMADGCPEKLDIPFLLYTLRFNSKNRKSIYSSISSYPEKTVIILKNDCEILQFLQSISSGETAKAAKLL
ncbi:MAG: AAA family ATPase [Clostridiaceae bacterium]|nr:AAA family ATPase [Clostridiaceae bacterium]